jgi:hypothetical protein
VEGAGAGKGARKGACGELRSLRMGCRRRMHVMHGGHQLGEEEQGETLSTGDAAGGCGCGLRAHGGGWCRGRTGAHAVLLGDQSVHGCVGVLRGSASVFIVRSAVSVGASVSVCQLVVCQLAGDATRIVYSELSNWRAHASLGPRVHRQDLHRGYN